MYIVHPHVRAPEGFVNLICYNQDLSHCPSFAFILVETVDYVGHGVSSRW